MCIRDRERGVKQIAMAGGVASNSALRETMRKACEKEGFYLSIPSPILCTDNAAMIGCAAYYEYMAGVRDGFCLLYTSGYAGTDAEAKNIVSYVLENKDKLVKKSQWIFGGDGWAYDCLLYTSSWESYFGIS